MPYQINIHFQYPKDWIVITQAFIPHHKPIRENIQTVLIRDAIKDLVYLNVFDKKEYATKRYKMTPY